MAHNNPTANYNTCFREWLASFGSRKCQSQARKLVFEQLQSMNLTELQLRDGLVQLTQKTTVPVERLSTSEISRFSSNMGVKKIRKRIMVLEDSSEEEEDAAQAYLLADTPPSPPPTPPSPMQPAALERQCSAPATQGQPSIDRTALFQASKSDSSGGGVCKRTNSKSSMEKKSLQTIKHLASQNKSQVCIGAVVCEKDSAKPSIKKNDACSVGTVHMSNKQDVRQECSDRAKNCEVNVCSLKRRVMCDVSLDKNVEGVLVKRKKDTITKKEVLAARSKRFSELFGESYGDPVEHSILTAMYVLCPGRLILEAFPLNASSPKHSSPMRPTDEKASRVEKDARGGPLPCAEGVEKEVLMNIPEEEEEQEPKLSYNGLSIPGTQEPLEVTILDSDDESLKPAFATMARENTPQEAVKSELIAENSQVHSTDESPLEACFKNVRVPSISEQPVYDISDDDDDIDDDILFILQVVGAADINLVKTETLKREQKMVESAEVCSEVASLPNVELTPTALVAPVPKLPSSLPLAPSPPSALTSASTPALTSASTPALTLASTPALPPALAPALAPAPTPALPPAPTSVPAPALLSTLPPTPLSAPALTVSPHSSKDSPSVPPSPTQQPENLPPVNNRSSVPGPPQAMKIRVRDNRSLGIPDGPASPESPQELLNSMSPNTQETLRNLDANQEENLLSIAETFTSMVGDVRNFLSQLKREQEMIDAKHHYLRRSKLLSQTVAWYQSFMKTKVLLLTNSFSLDELNAVVFWKTSSLGNNLRRSEFDKVWGFTKIHELYPAQPVPGPTSMPSVPSADVQQPGLAPQIGSAQAWHRPQTPEPRVAQTAGPAALPGCSLPLYLQQAGPECEELPLSQAPTLLPAGPLPPTAVPPGPLPPTAVPAGPLPQVSQSTASLTPNPGLPSSQVMTGLARGHMHTSIPPLPQAMHFSPTQQPCPVLYAEPMCGVQPQTSSVGPYPPLQQRQLPTATVTATVSAPMSPLSAQRMLQSLTASSYQPCPQSSVPVQTQSQPTLQPHPQNSALLPSPPGSVLPSLQPRPHTSVVPPRPPGMPPLIAVPLQAPLRSPEQQHDRHMQPPPQYPGQLQQTPCFPPPPQQQQQPTPLQQQPTSPQVKAALFQIQQEAAQQLQSSPQNMQQQWTVPHNRKQQLAVVQPRFQHNVQSQAQQQTEQQSLQTHPLQQPTQHLPQQQFHLQQAQNRQQQPQQHSCSEALQPNSSLQSTPTTSINQRSTQEFNLRKAQELLEPRMQYVAPVPQPPLVHHNRQQQQQVQQLPQGQQQQLSAAQQPPRQHMQLTRELQQRLQLAAGQPGSQNVQQSHIIQPPQEPQQPQQRRPQQRPQLSTGQPGSQHVQQSLEPRVQQYVAPVPQPPLVHHNRQQQQQVQQLPQGQQQQLSAAQQPLRQLMQLTREQHMELTREQHQLQQRQQLAAGQPGSQHVQQSLEPRVQYVASLPQQPLVHHNRQQQQQVQQLPQGQQQQLSAAQQPPRQHMQLTREQHQLQQRQQLSVGQPVNQNVQQSHMIQPPQEPQQPQQRQKLSAGQHVSQNVQQSPELQQQGNQRHHTYYQRQQTTLSNQRQQQQKPQQQQLPQGQNLPQQCRVSQNQDEPEPESSALLQAMPTKRQSANRALTLKEKHFLQIWQKQQLQGHQQQQQLQQQQLTYQVPQHQVQHHVSLAAPQLGDSAQNFNSPEHTQQPLPQLQHPQVVNRRHSSHSQPRQGVDQSACQQASRVTQTHQSQAKNTQQPLPQQVVNRRHSSQSQPRQGVDQSARPQASQVTQTDLSPTGRPPSLLGQLLGNPDTATSVPQPTTPASPSQGSVITLSTLLNSQPTGAKLVSPELQHTSTDSKSLCEKPMVVIHVPMGLYQSSKSPEQRNVAQNSSEASSSLASVSDQAKESPMVKEKQPGDSVGNEGCGSNVPQPEALPADMPLLGGEPIGVAGTVHAAADSTLPDDADLDRLKRSRSLSMDSGYKTPSPFIIQDPPLQSDEGFEDTRQSVVIPFDRDVLCTVCKKEAKIVCSGCKSSVYCSGKCQMFDWENYHQTVCGE